MKLQDMKMRDMKMHGMKIQDEVAGHEIDTETALPVSMSSPSTPYATLVFTLTVYSICMFTSQSQCKYASFSYGVFDVSAAYSAAM